MCVLSSGACGGGAGGRLAHPGAVARRSILPGCRAAVDRPGHALPVGGPPRRQHVRRAGLRRARRARAPRARGGPSSSRALVRDSRSGGGRLEAAPGEVARACRRRGAAAASGPAPRGAADRCRRTISDLFEGAAARRLPRPRAFRAQRGQHRAAPLARAQRRHLPRADRARRRHPGRAQGRAARLRAPRSRTATYGATAELLRRFFPGDYAIVAPGADRCARRERAATGRVRIAFVEQEERGACGCSCARCAASTRRCRGRRSCTPSAAPRPRRRCAPTCSSGCASSTTPRRRWPRPTSSSPRPTASPPHPALITRAQAAGAVPVASRLASTRRSWRWRGRAALRAQRPRDAQRPARAPDRRRRPARTPAGGRAAAAVERGGRRARGPVRDVAARRHDGRGNAEVAARAQGPAHHRRRPAHAHRPQP